MKSSSLGLQFCLPSYHSNLIDPRFKSTLLPFKTPSPSSKTLSCTSIRSTNPTNHSKPISRHPPKTSPKTNKPINFEEQSQPPIIKSYSKSEVLVNLSDGHLRLVMLGAISLGMAVFVGAGMDVEKAMALGPEGPLVEEFWDNVRRYGLYILTVSTGVIYTIFEPIVELLKNPITAILILVILGGSVYIVSQVVSAMVGVSEFPYEYAY
ncbi:hypothetical protein Sjap_025047 [Stephania japonica]|uniref:Uncharacterized protein ycf33 n=1 Tax=Stephania japonica TaxID=461633 RepID=A0AAP0E132_9MAGN